MASSLSFGFIGQVILSSLILLLLIATYTYVVSLEKKGCKCAETGDTKFIKGFTLFSIIYILISWFVPPAFIQRNLGSAVLGVKSIVDVLFIFVFVYYIYVVFKYTRYLINEKCKCSEDIRREIIMIGSLIEFILIFILFLLTIIIGAITAGIAGALSAIKQNEQTLSDAIKHPVESIRKIPSSLKKSAKTLSSAVKQASSDIKNIATKKIKQ